MTIADKELEKLNLKAVSLNNQGLSKEEIETKLKDYLLSLDDKQHALIAIATSKQEARNDTV